MAARSADLARLSVLWPVALRMPVATLGALVLAACALVGCGAAGPPAPERPRAWDRPLVDLVPTDASVVVIAEPSRLAAEPAAWRVLHAIAPDTFFERYHDRTGVDPRRLVELVWAGLPGGSVLLARGPFDARMTVAQVGARMLPLESRADEPLFRRAGHYAGARRELVALADGIVAVVTGSPATTVSVLGRLDHPTPWPEEILDLLREARGAPLIVLAPRPLRLPPSGVGLLLAQERALTGTISAEGPNDLAMSVDLRGEFPPGADRNFRQLVESLAETDLGGALGMRDALPTFTAQADESRVLLRATVPAAAVAAGLRVLFEAEIAEIVEGPAGLE